VLEGVEAAHRTQSRGRRVSSEIAGQEPAPGVYGVARCCRKELFAGLGIRHPRDAEVHGHLAALSTELAGARHRAIASEALGTLHDGRAHL